MGRGKYIVLEGAEGVGKTTMADLVVHELERLGLAARKMHEPDGTADATTAEIRRLTQDPNYPMNTRTEVLLYNAARSQSLEAVRLSRDSGEVVIVDRSYLTTLAVQFYGRADMTDYQRLNDIIAFAVGDMWPDLTIVLDAPVDILQKRTNKRGEAERFDALSADMLERIRAGYLWEAKQRNMPVVYSTGRIDEVFQEIWRHIAVLLQLENEAASEPTSVADLLAKSPVAKVLESKQQAPVAQTMQSYYIPAALPDDLQCDYCDDLDRLLSDRRKLVTNLTKHLQTADPALHNESLAKKQALKLLRPLLPVACAREELRSLLTTAERLEISEDVQKRLPNGFASGTEAVRLVAAHPRNELDILPAVLYESLDLPMNEVKATVETWPYEVKSQFFQKYLRQYPDGKALKDVSYEWDFLTELAAVQELPEELRTKVKLQPLTPRYGYDTPPEVEAAGLSDDYDAIFDQSLQLQSTLQARGFTTESQYATLLGHKQRWSICIDSISQHEIIHSGTSFSQEVQQIASVTHPLFFSKS